MKETLYLLIIALLAFMVFSIIIVNRNNRLKLQLQGAAKRIDSLKSYEKRYSLVKKFGNPGEFLDLIRDSDLRDLDGFLLKKLRIVFRSMINDIDGFVSAYVFIGSLEEEMQNFLQDIFLNVVREKSPEYIGTILFSTVISKGQFGRNELEEALAKIGDMDFSRTCYAQAAERLNSFIEESFDSAKKSFLRDDLQKELVRLKSLAV